MQIESEVLTKACKDCREIKPAREFYGSSNRDGLCTYCIACKKAREMARYRPRSSVMPKKQRPVAAYVGVE